MAADEMTGLDLERIRRMAEARFADMMSTAGVDHGRMATELLFFMPKDFVDAYAEMFHRAFGGKDDSGANGRGQMDEEKRVLGKASGKGLQGLGGARRKTYKKYWVIADEGASMTKTRMDKRLRGIAREIRESLAEQEPGDENTTGGSTGAERKADGSTRCGTCQQFVRRDWRFCPTCGTNIEMTR